jgi:outer membrane immunogenic protein
MESEHVCCRGSLGEIDAVQRWFLIATTLLATSNLAAAADLGPSPIESWSWTGCHLGGHAAGFWGRQEWVNKTPGGDFFGQSLGDHGQDGWAAGVQAGCDYQSDVGMVIGIEGNYAWTDAEGSHPSARETGVFYHSDVKSLASVTGRLGYGWDRVLGFVKGGVGWERDAYWATTLMLGTAYTANQTRSGWTVGAGAEYAFTSHLSAFLEYSHYDFGEPGVGLTPQVAGLRRGLVDLKETSEVLRAGINLRFGG